MPMYVPNKGIRLPSRMVSRGATKYTPGGNKMPAPGSLKIVGARRPPFAGKQPPMPPSPYGMNGNYATPYGVLSGWCATMGPMPVIPIRVQEGVGAASSCQKLCDTDPRCGAVGFGTGYSVAGRCKLYYKLDVPRFLRAAGDKNFATCYVKKNQGTWEGRATAERREKGEGRGE